MSIVEATMAAPVDYSTGPVVAARWLTKAEKEACDHISHSAVPGLGLAPAGEAQPPVLCQSWAGEAGTDLTRLWPLVLGSSPIRPSASSSSAGMITLPQERCQGQSLIMHAG